MWVEVVACRLVGHYFAAVKQTDTPKLNEMKEKYVLLANGSNIFSLAKQMCIQMDSKLLTGNCRKNHLKTKLTIKTKTKIKVQIKQIKQNIKTTNF
jgi:hypothetical protein